MKYYMAKRSDQQVELNIRLRALEMAANCQAVSVVRFWSYPTTIRLQNRKELKKLIAARNKYFDRRCSDRKRK